MLKNKLIIKKIRNICILLMAIIIMVGVYTNVRRSRAENVIQIELEVSDKSEVLGMQTIIVDATETQDGNYLLDLPTAVNGNIVTKYYTSDGAEVLMNDENADRTLTLTETEVADQKIQLQTDYDKKEITTEDGQIVTLYNKELLDEKEIEQNVIAEETNNDTQANETMTDETTEEPELDDTVIVTGYMPLDAQVDIEEIDLSTLSEITLPIETQTVQKAYEVSVYQTLRRTIDVNGNVIAEEIVTPESAMTEEVSLENTNPENVDLENETNSTTENIVSENAIENENVESVTETTTPDNTVITVITLKDGTRIEEEKVEYDPSIYNEQLVIKTKNTEANTITTIYGLQEDNQIVALENTTEEEYVDATFQKNSQTVRYIVATEPQEEQPNANNEIEGEGATDGEEQEATVAPNEIENSEWEVIESNPEILEGKMTVTLKGPSDGLTEDWVSLIVNGEKTESGIRKTVTEKKTLTDGVQYTVEITGIPTDAYQVKVQLEPKTSGIQRLMRTFGLSAETESDDSEIMLLATTYNTLKSASGENDYTSGFLGNTNIQRQYINQVIFSSSTSGSNSTKWDVSEAGDGSIMAWYTGSNPYTVYIGSSGTIYANQNSDYLFGAIGSGDNCTATTTISNINLLNTSQATSMNHMFWKCGYKSMTSLSLGSNFNTSNVTDMAFMFCECGTYKMTSLNLGSNFNTSKVTDMSYMFANSGQYELSSFSLGSYFDTSKVTNMANMFQYFGGKIANFSLGSKFNTSNVTNMYRMFKYCGHLGMTSFDLGDNFNTSKVTNMSEMFAYTGRDKLTNLNLGAKFYTTNVTDMSAMFDSCAYKSMTALELGPAFKKIAGTNTDIFKNTGKEELENVIFCRSEIYSSLHAFKLSSSSSSKITYDRGYVVTTSDGYKETTVPTWSTNTVDWDFDADQKTLSLELIGTDNAALKDASSILSSSNVTVKLGSTTVSSSNLIFGEPTLSSDSKTKTFPLTIRNYTGSSGTVTITIKAGALVDVARNTSVAKTYTVTPDIDGTAPTWASDVSNKSWSTSAKTYSLNLVGSDDTQLDSVSSTLSSSKVTVKVGGTTVSSSNLTFGTATLSSNKRTKTFPLTIKNYTGGTITITINAGALVDAAGNTSAAKTYTIVTDSTAPTWNSSVSGGTYSSSAKTYALSLVGKDEMALNNSSSTLNSSKVAVKVNGSTVSASNLTFGTATLSSDSKTKTFPLTIKNYTGGTITITISAGALVDTAGNTSVAKTYTIAPDTTAPVWADSISNATFSSSAKTYKFSLVGSDETSLNTTASTLTKSSNITITVNGTTTTNYTIGTATVSGNKKTFPITLNNFAGGSVKVTISAGALQDTAGNKSAAKTYTFSADGTAPTWANDILDGTYNADAKTYKLNFQGTDDTALATSTLSSSNVTVTADGVRLTNLSFGTVTTSSDNKTKTFPLTINNFPGGDIKITISAGALKDAAGNTSAQKVYEFEIDGVAPTWDANISNGLYNQSTSTYSFNLRGSDDVGLNNASSVLSTSNVTITVDGVNANFTIGNGTLNDKAKTFPVTINNFSGGTIIVKINAGALVDTSGNKSVAKQYTFTIDGTAPVWDEDVGSTSYSPTNKKYSFSLVGTDEEGLNDSASILNSSNMTITIDGKATTDWSVGTTTITGGKTKTFPITINNFSGGTVKVSINEGVLEDTSGNTSAAKEYTFFADITPPEFQEAEGVYNPEDQSYTITVTGTDNEKLDNVASQLTTSNINLTVGGTKVTPTITTTVSTTSIETYTLKWNNHTGETVSLTINEGALVDASGNKSAQKVYTFNTVDATKPVWNASISGAKYTLENDTDEFGTFTFNLIGSDETGLNDAQSLLDGKLTITTDGILVDSSDITIGNATLANGKTKTFPITVKDFKGGNVVITISKEALVDTTGNKSDSRSYTFFQDVTRPVWADSISNISYDQSTKQYSFNLVGSDENSLDGTKSVINSSNVTITVGGTKQNVTFGSATTSGNTKMFPITIPNYPGGNLVIIINKGALVDTTGNASLQKIYTITPDVSVPTWTYENVQYDADNKKYSVELIGRDEKELNTTLSTLVASGTGKNVTVKCGSTTVTPTITKLSTSSTEVRFRLTVNNYSGGLVTININEGALMDTGNNKSQAETITLPEKDIVKPTISAQNPEYSSAEKTYTFEIVAKDNTSIDNTTSSLVTSGNGKNVTITCAGGTIQEPTISIKEVTTTQIIYQVTIQNYPSGAVNVVIDAGAIKDTDGNSNNAITLTLPALDVANPYWQNTATVEYDETDNTLTIQVVGKDETSLNDAQSTLTPGGNLLINVAGQVIDYANVEIGETTISTDQLTKTFPIIINNYTGGIVEVSIGTGALKDNSGKSSDSKSYTFTDVIKPVIRVEETGTYDKATNTYTLTVHGTDDTSITTANLAGKLQVKVDGTTVTPTVTLTQDLAQEKTYTVAIPNYLGGKIDMTIAQGALVDGAGNLSNAVNFSITPDVTAPVWTMSNAEFDSTDSTYHTILIDLKGSDNMSLAESTLSTENLSVQFGSTVVDSSHIQIIGPTSTGDGKGGVSYQLKVSGYTGEDITVILSPETLIDDAGNTSVRTTLTTEAILPDSDDDIPTVSNIQYLVDAINTEVVIDFDITDSWYNFGDLIEAGEYTITGQNWKSTMWGMGSYEDVDLSSCTIEIEKEIRIENGYHYTIVIKGLQEVLQSGSSGGIGGMQTKYPLLSVTLNANAATDLFDKGNVATDLLKNQEINFSIKDGDASMDLIGVRLDETTGAMHIDLKATWTPKSTGGWWGTGSSANTDFTLTEDMITDIQIDGESVVDYFKEQGAGRIIISNEPATSTSGGSSGGWWRKLVGWCIKSIYQRDNYHLTRF